LFEEIINVLECGEGDVIDEIKKLKGKRGFETKNTLNLKQSAEKMMNNDFLTNKDIVVNK